MFVNKITGLSRSLSKIDFEVVIRQSNENIYSAIGVLTQYMCRLHNTFCEPST